MAGRRIRTRASRRSHLAWVAACALLLAVGAWIWQTRFTGRLQGPIVVISIDTLRADRLPVYGYTRTRTPAIARLAADGVVFEHAYAHSPQTLPSHTSILSGRLPFEHGVRDNVGFAVKPGERLLPKWLHDRGYVTGAFVSSYVLRRQTGFHQGFDVYDDALPAASPELPLGQIQRSGRDTIERAIAWIAERRTPKFFLLAHVYEPHRPYTPPARFKATDPYDGEVEYADEIVAALLEHLRDAGLYDPALIVLLSDHGEGLGDHGEDDHGVFLYRETIRVPLIVKLPRSRGAGGRVMAPVQHIDLVPTILDLAGANRPSQLRGRSLRATLESGSAPQDTPIYSEALTPRYHFGWSELYALSTERFRLIRAPRDELYDIVQDPGERSSIVAARPQLRATLRDALDAMIPEGAVETPSAVSTADRQRLAALGYVGAQAGRSVDGPGDRLPDPKDKIDVLRKYRHATALAGERRFAEAAALYREVLRDDPGMTDVWLQLAEAYKRQGLIGDAFEAFRNAIEQNPGDPAALTGAASALFQLRRFDEARTHAELAIDVAPAVAHELLARIAVESGDANRARTAARRAREADPTLPLPAFVEGLLLHKRGRYAEAVPHLLAARSAMAERTEQLADVNYMAADALARLERYAEAEPLFRAELAVFPDHIPARAGLAILLRMTGRLAESEHEMQQLTRRSRRGGEVAAQLRRMFAATDRLASAPAAQR